MSDDSIAFADPLPLNPVAPGTTIFVAGPGFGPTDQLALSMVTGGPESDATLVVSNRIGSGDVIERCTANRPDFDATRAGVVDCTGQQSADGDSGALVETVSSTGDLTGVGIKFSSLYGRLRETDSPRIRTGFVDVSTFLMYADLRTVYRFLHTIKGRTSGTGGLSVLVVKPGSHDEQTISTLAQLSDGRIDVREGDAGYELRIRGLANQPDGWLPLSLNG